MDGASIITIPRANWTALAARPAGWSVRRLERSDRTATYVTWDPEAVRCAMFLTPAPAEISDQLRHFGFTELTNADLTHTQVWARPETASVIADAA